MMKMNSMYLLNVVVVLFAILIIPATGHSNDIAIDLGRPYSVAVTEARIVERSDQGLKLAGQLFRPHRLPKAGHLHAYVFLEGGELVSSSKHRVMGLNSQRGGSMRVPFRISIEDGTNDLARIYLEYHNPGHPEI